jgi:trans-aconitate methyltransferase
MNHQHHQRPGGHDQHRVLDLGLDAEVFGDHLAAVLDVTGVPAARSVDDLGTGAGSRLLRERYPDAAATCVDNDPQTLELLRKQGFAVIEADLDHGLPELAGSLITADAVAEAPVDLVWASSSLHHVTHPAQLLSGVRRALAPGGSWSSSSSPLSPAS